MPIPPDFTDLDIVFDLDVPGLPGVNPYSARGLRGTLSPIDAARGIDKLARTVNGSLIDISAPQMRKYRLEVSGQDQAPPALDGVWVGRSVIVNSHVELAYRTGGGGSPFRSPVAGSSRVERFYTYYRPQFTMLVVDWQIERAEWDQDVSWSLTLEEV
jgi:hypothetical protein